MDINKHVKKYFEAIKPVANELSLAGFKIKKDDFNYIKAKDGTILKLNKIGISVEEDDLQYLGQKYKPLPKEAVDILLKWILKINYEPVQEVLVSQLRYAKTKYDGNILLELFKHTKSRSVRERIGFVLGESKSIVDIKELRNILLDSNYDNDKLTLLLVGIRLLPADYINAILLKDFDKNMSISLNGLKKRGGKKEIEFLKKRLDDIRLSTKWKNEIKKTIRQIEKNISN